MRFRALLPVLLVLAAPLLARGQATPATPSPAPAAGPAAAPGAPPTAAPAPAPTAPATASAPEKCASCHAAIVQRKVPHAAVDDCTSCHQVVPNEPGKCRSRSGARWILAKKVPDELCLDCHEIAALVGKKAVRHAPAAEGRCLGCHDPHGSGEKAALRAAPGSSKGCLACHGAAAPTGKGTPSPAFRVDLGRKHVHDAVSGGDCGDCHDAGHGGDLPRLVRKVPAELCRGCHDKVGKERFPHSAVLLGDCTACHDPHSSDAAKLLARPTEREVCFVCHADDLTGRAVVHAPIEGGCSQCHAPHGGPNRFGLKAAGKDVCYGCHKPVDAGKVKHAAIERYGCTICHDPHATANRFLVAKPVTALCATCHPGEADGRHVTTLARAGHAVSGGADPKRPGRDFSCASCHDPHASDHPRLFRYGDSAMQSCDWCHGDKTGKNPELKDVSRRASGAPPGVTGAGGPGGGGFPPSPPSAPSPPPPSNPR